MKLQYGIISTATISDRFIHAVKSFGDGVYAIASRTIEKAQDKAKQHGIEKVYGNYEQLYQDEKVDIVYIATNNATHVEEIKKALFYRKHVVCEKPLALSEKEASELFAYATQQGCFLMEAQKSIFLPITQLIKDYLSNKQLGVLHQVEMSASFPNPTSSWMFDPSQGGVIYGSASYTLEYLDYLLEPTSTKVEALGFCNPKQACNRVSLNVKMDHVLINSRISMGYLTQNHAIFYFEKGWIKVDHYWKAKSAIVQENQQVTQIDKPIDYEMVYEVEHIHQCIEQGLLQSPIMDAKRTITCCKFVDEMINDIM